MRTILLLLPAALLVGCTSTRTLAPGGVSGTVANAELADRAASVVLADGRVVEARSVAVYADSTSWVDAETGAFVHVPTADVRSVSRRVRGRAAWQGALVSGVAVGAVMTAIVISGTGDAGSYNGVRNALGAAVGLMAAVPASALGGGVGYLSGAEDRYEIRPAEAAPAPPASGDAADEDR